MKRLIKAVPLCVALALAACAHEKDLNGPDATLAYATPQPDIIAPDVTALLSCIAETRVLEGKRFAVGPYANETGKLNQVSDGATGHFLPNGPNISIYAMEAISKAGAEAYDYTNLDIVRNIATVGGDHAAKILYLKQRDHMPHFGVTVFATALDFKGAQRADVRIAGVGPTFLATGARAHYAAHIIEPGSQRSLARGFALYDAEYTEAGIGGGKFFGGGTGTLVTGNISVANQQPLQRPTAEGIMLSVAYALLEIPGLRGCRTMVGESG